MIRRSPIIVILGHVDHGKSTLIDFIRKTNITAKEPGGITQSIGAYEIWYTPEKKITFIDTPGHEAFSCMRVYGANVADIAILLVAADDGVQKQTKEVIQCIVQTKIPYIVAINKIDKLNADVEKTKNELMQANVFLEGAGGNISWQIISAKTGEGVQELLELILLASEMENLEYEPQNPAKGIILTSHIAPKRGITAGIVLKDGTLNYGDYITTESTKGKIKILENFLGQPVKNLNPSSPALIIGFEELPKIGEEFTACPNSQTSTDLKIKHTAHTITEAQKSAEHSEKPKNVSKIILKADETGSLEVLQNIIQKISKEFSIQVIDNSVGSITENDIKTAASAKAAIFGFKSKADKAALNLAKAQKIIIISSNIIYELEKQAKELLLKSVLKQEHILEVLAVFGSRKGKQQVIGGKAIQGAISNKESFEIWLGNKQIGKGKIINLQTAKKDVVKIEEGEECGLFIESDVQIAIGNKLIFRFDI